MTNLQELYYNQTNSTQSPIELIFTIVPSFYQIFSASLLTSLLLNNIKEQTFQSYCARFILDIVFIIIPSVLDVTMFANEHKYLQHVIFIVISYFTLIISISKLVKSENRNITIKMPVHFITIVRSAINVVAVISILAVDFKKVFPNRFRKTRYFGFSLMDVGVGFFVFSNGIVAPELHRPTNSIIKSLIGSFPILFIGLLRLLLVTLTNYTVSPTEYGLHWNFFMTLAVTRILSSMILKVISVKHSLFVAIIILLLHEYLLQTGLGAWVLDKHVLRDNLIDANREGIVSALGYVGLYFLSITVGKLVNSRYNNNVSIFKLFFLMGLYSFILFVFTIIFHVYFGVSRRLASPGYCLWITFLGTSGCLLFAILEICLLNVYKIFSIKNQVYVPLIFEAVNYNGLLFFLLANVITGLLNLAIINHKEEMMMAIIITIVYMVINCIVVTVLYKYNIKITRIINDSLIRMTDVISKNSYMRIK